MTNIGLTVGMTLRSVVLMVASRSMMAPRIDRMLAVVPVTALAAVLPRAMKFLKFSISLSSRGAQHSWGVFSTVPVSFMFFFCSCSSFFRSFSGGLHRIAFVR